MTEIWDDKTLTREQKEQVQKTYDYIAESMNKACGKLIGHETNEDFLKGFRSTFLAHLKSLAETVCEDAIQFSFLSPDNRNEIVPANFYTFLRIQGLHVNYAEVAGKTEYTSRDGRRYKWNTSNSVIMQYPKAAEFINIDFVIKPKEKET